MKTPLFDEAWHELQEYRSKQASIIDRATITMNELSNQIRTLCLKKKDSIDSLERLKRVIKQVYPSAGSKLDLNYKEVVNNREVEIKLIEKQIQTLHDELLVNIEVYNNILKIFKEQVY